MPWVRALLRGQKVLARVTPDGAFASEGGRVEIRYKPNDPRAYRAGARNLERIPGEEVLPEDTCVPAGAAPAAPEKEKKARKAEPQPALPVSKDAWTVYADGACSGNPGPAGLGIVLIAPDRTRLEGYEYLGIATNNIAELTAILRATEIVPRGAPAVVHTDSQYSIGVLSKGWKAKANQELIASIRQALKLQPAFRLQYVPGHAGVELNERADALAREAVSSRSSKLPRAPEPS
jgi:ribonuclease HI